MYFKSLLFLIKSTSRQTLVLCLLVLMMVLCAASFLVLQQSKYTITLTDSGFKPARVVIREGDTVTFKTTAGAPFWPASNVHPTHTAYPDFDPQKPIASSDSWSFTFKEAGTYRFHDHIASNFEGEVIVEKKDGSRITIDCSKDKTVSCWEKLMLDTLKQEGVEAAFNAMLHLSETEPLFHNDCHGYSHLIGEKAYELYVAKDNFELTPATALCGYGFYHGFMETMLLTTGNIEEAREFCEYVDSKLRGQASAASTACYHGTGHGAIDGSDPTTWGDVDAMMAPGFKLCELLAQDELQSYLCDTGVFNAIEILSADPKYGLQSLREDPFEMCNRQTLERREGCYANMLPIILDFTRNDFDKAAAYINDNMIDHNAPAIDGHTVNELTTIGLMFEFLRVYGEEEGFDEKAIDFCRRQPEEDTLACIEGISGGFIKYGEPGVEYERNLEFCEHSLLTPEEKDSCYAYTLQRLSGRYTPQKTQEICSLVEVEYSRKYCPRY